MARPRTAKNPGKKDENTIEKKMDEIDALGAALAQERVATAQLTLATRQKELDGFIAKLRTKYEDSEYALSAIDTNTGVLQLTKRSAST